jgi:hypothetical protein
LVEPLAAAEPVEADLVVRQIDLGSDRNQGADRAGPAGNWREEHLFALKQAVKAYEFERR